MTFSHSLILPENDTASGKLKTEALRTAQKNGQNNLMAE